MISILKKLQLVDLNLINTKISLKNGFIEAGISIEANRINKIAKLPNMPKALKTIDVKGNIVLPGLIDVHTHLRVLELSYKEDFNTGTCAAAAGGFTTVLDMPNTTPPTNTPERLKEKIQRAKDRVIVNVGFYAAFPKQLKQIVEMNRNGAIAFKVFLYHPITELNVNCDEVLLKIFNSVKQLNRPIAVHAEEGEITKRLEENLRKSGKSSLNHRLKVHSIKREVNAVQRVVNLAKKTGTHIHFCHISAASSIKHIIRLKQCITCETTPHHILLTNSVLRKCGSIALMNPPLRSRLNTTRLWHALNKGQIDILASDHAPHALQEKKNKNIWEVSPGIPGLETTLPLMLTQVNKGRMPWGRLIQILATKPAEIFQLNRGFIKVGSAADLVIVDMKKEYKIDSSKFYSKAKYSPFDGQKVKGKPIKTFVNGRLVYDSGEIVAEPGSGTILTGSSNNCN